MPALQIKMEGLRRQKHAPRSEQRRCENTTRHQHCNLLSLTAIAPGSCLWGRECHQNFRLFWRGPDEEFAALSSKTPVILTTFWEQFRLHSAMFNCFRWLLLRELLSPGWTPGFGVCFFFVLLLDPFLEVGFLQTLYFSHLKAPLL